MKRNPEIPGGTVSVQFCYLSDMSLPIGRGAPMGHPAMFALAMPFFKEPLISMACPQNISSSL